jgi:serine/threonine-protein kinase
LLAQQGADTALRAAVESLLHAHDALTGTRGDRIAHGVRAGLDDVLGEAKPGQRFGPFRVVRELARGGMGVVYLAERADGTVAQRVALKLVGNDRAGTAATARLSREYRLLAALEHPYIARLIDAGNDESGIAYFAMEYVQGERIDRYCDSRALALDRRLRLFVEICSAVQHAHANLIVHRDLKAANILIREDGLPKLLDFGIATTVGLPGNAIDAAPAQERERFLSVHCAAPEQFADGPVGIAADVYALGVLLCELAAGVQPLQLAGLDAAHAGERVLHDPPLAPSHGVDAVAASRRGGLAPTTLRRRLAGDIDAIVARCLAKRPQDRYPSVALLAEDVERHLQRRPLAIRAGERGYRARRFVQRNAPSVALALLLGILLAGFVAFGVASNRRLAVERDEAASHERQARFQQARAQQVTDFLLGLFRASNPEQRRGRDIGARELLDRGRSRLAADSGLQPALRASLLAAMSDVYRALDDLDGAEQMAQEAAALRAHDTDDADGRFESLRQLARIDNLRGRSALALERVRQARALTGALDSADRAELLGIEALAIEGTGKAKDATALWREALALQAAAFGTDDARTLRATMDLAANLGIVGQGVEAEQLLTENLPRMRRGLASDDPVLGESLRDLSRLARRKKEYARAEALADEALVVYRRIYGDDSSQAAAAMTTAAIGAQANGHADKARALMEKALRTQRAVFGAESAQVATAEYNLGLHLQLHADDRQGALAHLRVAAELGSRLLPAGHPSLANYRLALGSSLREAHQRAEATVVLRQALATFEVANAPRGVDKALARGELACNALPWQEDDGMRRQFEDALAALTREVPDDAQAQRVRACTAQRGGTGKT